MAAQTQACLLLQKQLKGKLADPSPFLHVSPMVSRVFLGRCLGFSDDPWPVAGSELSKNPVDGFSAGLVDDNNIFEWSVTIIGPPDTLYEGGYFNAIMSFPENYPNSPPSVRFTSDMWHPNVYPDGRVCISILHAPGDDPSGYELASERWSPVHTVESIVLSIVSMLSSPNDESPANIEAAKEWREKRDEFKKKVSRIVRRSQEML
ncbi:hypothetical protein Taro_000111 [Colocasia esculenta]|uniref:E2 ubiquitin-conjugating enzyme n=1 Tax=Colocasia esculenta TaxID=4460 RepID=A0A843TB76_COLES|nr:hypothetical protein [Colocasia esculenta]